MYLLQHEELFVGRATVGSNKIAKERAGVPYLTVAVCSIQENGSVPFRQILAGKLPLGLTTDKENVAISNFKVQRGNGLAFNFKTNQECEVLSCMCCVY